MITLREIAIIMLTGHLICNQRVGGSNPSGGTTKSKPFSFIQQISSKTIYSSFELKKAHFLSSWQEIGWTFESSFIGGIR